jgi:PelA/Pel-15E family pectate lyase
MRFIKESEMNVRSGFLLSALLSLVAAVITDAAQRSISWKDALDQEPRWYGGREAIRIADNLLLFQRDSGGWPKDIDMAAVLNDDQKADLAIRKSRVDSTIDNGATHTQMVYLARVFSAAKVARYKESFIKGLDFLLAAQYENGGWPQFYPKPSGYHKHITFNDDAMIGVMNLLRGISRREPAYAFVDEGRRVRAEKAIERGIECILKCQIVVDNKLTVWCAQHDEVTFEPAPARSYEKVSLSGSESVNIVRFLMGIERPDRRVIESIKSAVAWFETAKLTGIKQVEIKDASLPKGFDRVIVVEPPIPSAPSTEPLWARFYEIGNNRPIFCGRDGIIKYSLAEIEHERRIGYNWYTSAPAGLLAKDYPTWEKRLATESQRRQGDKGTRGQGDKEKGRQGESLR